MTGLFLDLSEYYTDPIEEEFEVYMDEQYYYIPSISNKPDWALSRVYDEELYLESRRRLRGDHGRFIKSSAST